MGSRGNQVDMFVRSERDADALMDRVRQSAQQVCDWMAVQRGDPLDMLQRMKFAPIGFHPSEGYALNLIEQVNQTWTYAVAIAASKQLLRLHPDVGGFHLAPGAHASRALDVMSDVENAVGAETCAVVDPRNNGKLAKDLAKLALRPEANKYAFFMCPNVPGN